MRIIIKLFLVGLLVMFLAYILPGVTVTGYAAALWVALILGILNAVVRPVLVILSLPITFLTLGLFLLVINALIILLADFLISGFRVEGFLTALLFSVLLSIGVWVVEKIIGDKK